MSNRNGSKGPGASSGQGGDRKAGKKPAFKLGQKPRAKAANTSFAFETDERPRLQKPRTEKQAQPQKDMRLGEFTVERMGHDGRGITRWNGKTLFVDGAIQGEQISARLVQEHSTYAEARVDKVLAPSPLRETPSCIHYSVCGGCQIQHIRSAEQLVFKENVVMEQLERWGEVKPLRRLPSITSPSTGYRRSARLGVWYEDGAVTLGFRQHSSKQLVQIDDCKVLVPELNRLLEPLQLWLAGLHSAKAVTHIELVYADNRSGIIVRHTKKLADADLQHMAELATKLDVDAWLQGSDSRQLQNLSGQNVDPRLTYTLVDFDVTLAFHPHDFIQVNSAVNQQMVAQALQLMALEGHERVLDLFCGIGNFTLPLARRCGEVIGIEAVESMVMRGRENAAALGITNAGFIAANLLTMTEHRLQQTCGTVDAVLLDPPRDGAKEIIAKVAQLSPKRIVYVSCNPATLARDAKILASTGYQLDSVGVMDMFPHTAHIESMALFVRR